MHIHQRLDWFHPSASVCHGAWSSSSIEYCVDLRIRHKRPILHGIHKRDGSLVCILIRCRRHDACAIPTQDKTLHHTATLCNTLQYTATHCNTLQYTATHGNMRQNAAARCNMLHYAATCCNTPQHAAAHWSTLEHGATCCNSPQLAATRCNTPPHTATS